MECNRKKCVIYTRYSSHNQRDVSIEQQLKACKKYISDLEIELIEVYADRALSGTTDRRPEFQRMIKDAEKGLFDYIVVYTLDRFARDRYDSAVYKRKLKNYGVKVLSAMENITDDATGILLESMLEGLAEYYSAELARKVTRGMQDNAEKCLVNGSLPYGYIKDSSSHYAIDPDKAPVVVELFQRVANGEPYVTIAQDFNNRGLRTAHGKKFGKSSFVRMLGNERYRGIYIYKDARKEGGIPRIIDDNLFFEVQEQVKVRNQMKNSPKTNSDFRLTGKLYCGECGSLMTGTSGTSRTGAKYYYYFCTKKNGKCDKKNVRRDIVENSVVQAIRTEILENEDVINWIVTSILNYRKKEQHSDEITVLRARKAEIETSLSNIMKAIEAGIFTETTKSRMEDLENEKAEVTAKIAAGEMRKKELTADEIYAWIDSFRYADFEDPDFAETLFNTFVYAVYLYDNDDLKIVFNTGTDSTKSFNMSMLSSGENGSDTLCNSSPNVSYPNHLLSCVNGVVILATQLIKKEA